MPNKEFCRFQLVEILLSDYESPFLRTDYASESDNFVAGLPVFIEEILNFLRKIWVKLGKIGNSLICYFRDF